MPQSLAAVVVHRDRPQRCAATVRALLDQGLALDVVVVDNGSTPAHRKELRAGLPPAASVLEAGENLGFGPGANAGFRHLLGRREPPEWIALAPHDVRPAPGCLARLLAEAVRRPRAGLVSADLGDGATPAIDPYFGAILRPARRGEGWEPAGHPHGTLLLVRRALLDEVGMFDERYFAYCEEADLALRAAAAGWETGLVRGALVVNTDVGSGAAVVDYLQLRNTLLLVREHSGRYHAAVRAAFAVAQLAGGLVRRGRRGPWFDPRARVRALADHWRGRYGPPPASLAR